MSPAVRGLWPAQAAMGVTTTAMENMRETSRRGCAKLCEGERTNGQNQGLPRVPGVQWSSRQGTKAILEDLTPTFHYSHWYKP